MRSGALPRREHEREAGQASPLGREVQDHAPLLAGLQRGIADDEPGVRFSVTISGASP